MAAPLADYDVIRPADISAARFVALLLAGNSPAASEGIAMHGAIVGRGVSPLFALAMFMHESGMGRLGIAADHNTKSIGNVRTPANPENGGVIINVPGRGHFARYPTWEAGARDWADRLRGPLYEGAGLTSVARIIPRWAPESDGNAPETYIRSVLGFIARHLREEPPMPTTPPIRVDYLPAGASNRPGLRITPRMFTIHETANTSPGATAAMHRAYVHSGGGPQSTSYNFVVDDREAFALVPVGESSYHAGTPEGNISGVSMEICVNRPDGSPEWERALGNAIAIVANVYRETPTLDEPETSLVPHRHWRDTACPARLSGARWAEFKARAVAAIRAGGPDPDDAKLEAAYQANSGAYGGKRFAGVLTRDFYRGKVLVTDRAVLTPDGRDLSGHVIDDFITYNEDAGTLRRLG